MNSECSNVFPLMGSDSTVGDPSLGIAPAIVASFRLPPNSERTARLEIVAARCITKTDSSTKIGSCIRAPQPIPAYLLSRRRRKPVSPSRPRAVRTEEAGSGITLAVPLSSARKPNGLAEAP